MISRKAADYTCYDDIVWQMLRSNDPELDGHFFWGVNDSGELEFLDRGLAYQHLQALGKTGSGKTLRGLIPLLVQEIRRRKSRVVFIDPKGSNGAFRTLGEEARRAGLPFKYFALESDRAGYGFFPLKQECWKRLSVEEKTQLLLSAKGLEYGDAAPGLAYWGVVCETFLRGIFNLRPNAETFVELEEVAKDPNTRVAIGMGKRDFDNAGAVTAHLSRLASIRQINSGPPAVENAAIDINECLHEPGVYYFWIPTQRVPITGRAVGRLFVSELLSHARALGRAPVQQVVATDEFQTLAQRSFVDALKQARDLAITCWIAHQNLSDLESGTQSMLDAVIGNVSVRVTFTASDTLGKKYLKDSSDRITRTLQGASRTISEGGNGVGIATSDSLQETREERISADEILRLNATDGLCIAEAYPKRGLTQLNGPTFLYMPHICSMAEYERRERAPWPEPNQFTMLGAVPPDPEPPTAGGSGGEPPEGPEPPVVSSPRRPRRSNGSPRRRTRAANSEKVTSTFPTSPSATALGQYLLDLSEGQQ